jgi:hypothetical protein
MGCDIHMFVEYANKKRLKEQREENKPEWWMCFGGKMNPGRNYTMFGLLCRGVRSNFEMGFPKKERLGIDEMSYETKSEMFQYISETPDFEGSTVNIETALRYQKYGSKLYKDSNGEYTWVDNPDWHSHSWLSLDEFETALDLYKKIDDPYLGVDSDVPLEWRAILSAMKVLEDDGDNEVRVVFWFDN